MLVLVCTLNPIDFDEKYGRPSFDSSIYERFNWSQREMNSTRSKSLEAELIITTVIIPMLIVFVNLNATNS